MDPVRRATRVAFGQIDRLFHWRIQGHAVGPMLVVGQEVFKETAKVFEDGTRIEQGDLIGSFHVNNLAASRLVDRSSRAAALQFGRLLKQSMEVMAANAANEPRFSGLQVYRSVSWMPPHGARLGGFVLEPLPRNFRRKMLSVFFRALLYGFAPAKETRAAARPDPTVYWITRKELLRRFYKKATAP